MGLKEGFKAAPVSRQGDTLSKEEYALLREARRPHVRKLLRSIDLNKIISSGGTEGTDNVGD
jgi:hypothetical protein